MAQPHSSIPIFGLFGEAALQEPLGFGHIETIAARSSLHDWEIAPHAHAHALQVLLLTEGEAFVQWDGQAVELAPPAYIILPAGCVHGFRFAPETCGLVLTLAQDFLARADGPQDPLGRLLARAGHGPLSEESCDAINALAPQMLALADQAYAVPAQNRRFMALAEALLRALPTPQPDDAKPSHSTRHYTTRLRAFQQLVERHYRQHRSIGFYASQLGCTPRTLARLTQAQLGASPLDLVNHRLCLEAQRLLRYTNASITQVAQALGFADPSYFSRFYLRMTGQRPLTEKSGAGPISRPASSHQSAQNAAIPASPAAPLPDHQP